MTLPSHNSQPVAAQPFKVAAVEFNPHFMEFSANIPRIVATAIEAASNGAQLIVFPEAATSGYIYRDRDQFDPFLDTVPGVTTTALAEVTAQYGCYIAIGIAEKDVQTSLAYNTGALIGPEGYIGKYRKVGLNPSDQLWFAPGNTGYPVFDTALGRITMIICYDDTYWDSARMAALKGADLIAYICSSDRVLPSLGAEASGNHSTIAAVQQLSAWNGLAMVAADRNNAESNPTTGITVTYGGCASIWQADGTRTAHSPATSANTTMTNPGQILYGEIDPGLFDNEQKRSLQRRRPDLYRDLQFYRVPTDGAATAHPIDVQVTAIQYELGDDFDTNANTAQAHIDDLVAHGPDSQARLVVLPAYSFCGVPASGEQAAARAESSMGPSSQLASDFAATLRAYVVVSFIEKSDAGLHHTAHIISPDGQIAGSYRQTHLDDDQVWAVAGDQLTVVETEIGRIGMMLNSDVRFPEVSGVLAVRRADIIAIPTVWDGSYGGQLHDAAGLFAHQYPANTMCLWYAVAKTSQAYTVVANSVGNGAQGSSGVFSINPIDSDEPPVVASSSGPDHATMSFSTGGDPRWWMNQSRILAGRRVDLLAPALLPQDSELFRQWQQTPGYAIDLWSAYRQ